MNILLIILLILIIICLVLAGYLLISPIKLDINSRVGYLRLGWNRRLSARVSGDAEKWQIFLQIWFWQKTYSIEEWLFTQVKKEEKIVPIKSTNSKKSRFHRPSIQKIIREITVTKFIWSLDTDDFILNAYLAPVFEVLNMKSSFNTHINFTGKNEIILRAESRIINMLKAGIF